MALRDIRTIADTENISPELKEMALKAIASARECVELCVHNQAYRDGMKFAVAYTHTCAAFAGSFLLRFARLFPGEMDVLATIALVEELAQVLGQGDSHRFVVRTWTHKRLELVY